MNLLARLRRSHTPDLGALSALLDGRLSAPAATELNAHVAGCAVCAARLDELRAVKSMLSAMPEVDAPRSFRLRSADVQSPSRTPTRAVAGPLRWAPALSGVAAALFVAVLVADVTSRDGGGESSGDSLGRIQGGGFAEDTRPEEAMSDAAAETPAADAAAPIVPMTSADDAAGGADGEAAPPNEVCPTAATENLRTLDPDGAEACAPGTALELGREATADAAATQEAGVIAANAPSDDDHGGNRAGFLIVEIVAAIVAVGSAVAFFAYRGRKMEDGRPRPS